MISIADTNNQDLYYFIPIRQQCQGQCIYQKPFKKKNLLRYSHNFLSPIRNFQRSNLRFEQHMIWKFPTQIIFLFCRFSMVALISLNFLRIHHYFCKEGSLQKLHPDHSFNNDLYSAVSDEFFHFLRIFRLLIPEYEKKTKNKNPLKKQRKKTQVGFEVIIRSLYYSTLQAPPLLSRPQYYLAFCIQCFPNFQLFLVIQHKVVVIN